MLIQLAFAARSLPLDRIEIKNKQASVIRNSRFIQVKSLEATEINRVVNQEACPKVQTMMKLCNSSDATLGHTNKTNRIPNRVVNIFNEVLQ